MQIFEEDFSSVPILVCLTYADKLYEERCDDDMFPKCPEHKLPRLEMQLEDELEVHKYFYECVFDISYFRVSLIKLLFLLPVK